MTRWPEDIEPGLFVALLDAIEPVAMSAARREAVLARVLAATATRPPVAPVGRTVVVPHDGGQWLPLLPGVAIKPLHVDRAARVQTSLWRLAAGARVPAHDHDADEECLVVDGTLLWDGVTYRHGDYLLAPKGLHHTEFGSPDGATLLIRGELTAPLEQLLANAGY